MRAFICIFATGLHKMRVVFIVLFLARFSCVHDYRFHLEVRSEEDNTLIPGAKIELVESHQKHVLINGVFEQNFSHPNHHVHITSVGYETVELDVDLSVKTEYIVFMHITSIELKESIIYHDLVSSSDRNASITITGVDRDALLISNAGSFAENLESIPGVSSINVGVGIAKPVIRGLSGLRIQVAEAGLRQEGQQWGNDHGLEMDQYGIERLEVIKGPAAVIFGPDAKLNRQWKKQFRTTTQHLSKAYNQLWKEEKKEKKRSRKSEHPYLMDGQ